MNGHDESKVKDLLQTALKRLTIATVALFLALAAVFGYAFIQANHARAELEVVARTTASALCSLRADLERRVQTSKDFLEENPDGIPGLPAEVIKEGIENQQRTIEALAILHCPPERV